MSKTVKRFAIGAALVGAAGYLAGILTAPKSGKETRQGIKDATNRGMNEAEKDLKRLLAELNSIIDTAQDRGGVVSDKAKQELNQLLDKAKDTKEKLREMLSAIHEGETEDQDLQQAIKDANQAIDHIKDYLKK